MTTDLLIRLTMLLFGIIILGTLACVPLYKWNISKLLHSSLFIKIMWWIPIFIIIMAIVYGGLIPAIIITIGVIALGTREFMRQKAWSLAVPRIYYALFVVWMLHLLLWFLVLPAQLAVTGFIAVCSISIFSDVCAFFLGNYAGKHKLPKWLNNHKSWEGVAGQLIGAIIGGLIVMYYLSILVSPLAIGIIGIASAIGDLANSAAKRVLSVKDWGTTIPGHGGIMDRLSSLSLSLAVAFWIIHLTGSL